MQESVICEAQFDPKVKRYWLVLWCLIAMASVFFIPFLPIIALLVLLLSQRILDAMSAQLMTRKLIVKRGIMFKVEKSVPLDKITDVGMIQGPLMRMFGVYRLTFETAGQSAPGALVSMIGIVDAADFREKILAQKERLAQESSVLTSVAASANPSQNSQMKEAGLNELNQSVRRIEKLLLQLVEKKH
ncbi:PH domain-containing protein [Ningiella sp. W23]|uniref:PH domain-containing protein n=1 Tax=Ningiella sp. W23 TaxID=3023715 RepID=UPI003757DBC9